MFCFRVDNQGTKNLDPVRISSSVQVPKIILRILITPCFYFGHVVIFNNLVLSPFH